MVNLAYEWALHNLGAVMDDGRKNQGKGVPQAPKGPKGGSKTGPRPGPKPKGGK